MDIQTRADKGTEIARDVASHADPAIPNDAMVGEEQAPKPDTSGKTWVIGALVATPKALPDLLRRSEAACAL